MLVCNVRAVPVYWVRHNSLIAAEYCAESATTANPQTKQTRMSPTALLPYKKSDSQGAGPACYQ